MADQKSRGGQKQGQEKQGQGKKNRDVRGNGGNQTQQRRGMSRIPGPDTAQEFTARIANVGTAGVVREH